MQKGIKMKSKINNIFNNIDEINCRVLALLQFIILEI